MVDVSSKPWIKREIDKLHDYRSQMACVNRNAGVIDSYLHCASLIRNDTVLNTGFNIRNNSQRGLHAEMHVISKCYHREKRRITSDLLVIRLSYNGTKLAESRPCKECIKYMYNNSNYKIRNVIYSTAEGIIRMEKLNYMMNNVNSAHSTCNKNRTNL